MFIPLGFGNWLKKFPFIILAITFVCVYWSVQFFKVIHDSEKKDLIQTSSQKEYELKLTKQVIYDACLIKIEVKKDCDEIMEKLFAKEDPSVKTVKPKKHDNEKLTEVIGFVKKSAELGADIRKPIDEWPDYFKKSKSYSELRQLVEQEREDVLKKSAHLGFLTSKSFNVMNLIRASFTHGNYSHLLGNLFMLILIGVWVEQRMGPLLTFLTFITGSFFGLGFQIWQVPDHSVIGSSAGIFAIMGAYFVFFYKSEIRFLFTLFPFYFRRLFLPAAWTFPFFYFIGEFTAAANNENTGVGHFAHIGGLLLGCSVAYFVKKNDNLPTDQLFNEEAPLIQNMKNAKTGIELWKNFKDLIAWNCQNWTAIALFLRKAKELPIDLSDPKNVKLFEKQMRITAAHFLKYGNSEEVLDFVSIIPASANLNSCLLETPLKQVLLLADQLANEKDYFNAKRLYESSLQRKPDIRQKQSIETALNSINLILAENAQARGV